MQEFLAVTDIIDWQNYRILELSAQLAIRKNSQEEIAKACFEWVRDNIKHSYDYQMNPVTCRTSDVLQCQTGYCFAKSHLLAALLRANQIPAGFCYQRLSIFDYGAPYSLHGFNAVFLPQYGWYRIDARGNKKGIEAQFTPPQEKLAYKIHFPEEVDCQTIFSQPLKVVVTALQSNKTWDQMLDNLPDVEKSFFD